MVSGRQSGLLGLRGWSGDILSGVRSFVRAWVFMALGWRIGGVYGVCCYLTDLSDLYGREWELVFFVCFLMCAFLVFFGAVGVSFCFGLGFCLVCVFVLGFFCCFFVVWVFLFFLAFLLFVFFCFVLAGLCCLFLFVLCLCFLFVWCGFILVWCCFVD